MQRKSDRISLLLFQKAKRGRFADITQPPAHFQGNLRSRGQLGASKATIAPQIKSRNYLALGSCFLSMLKKLRRGNFNFLPDSRNCAASMPLRRQNPAVRLSARLSDWKTLCIYPP
jgi:hypothetical protein